MHVLAEKSIGKNFLFACERLRILFVENFLLVHVKDVEHVFLSLESAFCIRAPSYFKEEPIAVALSICVCLQV